MKAHQWAFYLESRRQGDEIPSITSGGLGWSEPSPDAARMICLKDVSAPATPWAAQLSTDNQGLEVMVRSSGDNGESDARSMMDLLQKWIPGFRGKLPDGTHVIRTAPVGSPQSLRDDNGRPMFVMTYVYMLEVGDNDFRR